ncbi:MAG: hypothetical protein WBZ50_01640 [Nitrososphaeraceae archaeon]
MIWLLSNHTNTEWWFASSLFAIFKVRQFPAGFEQGKKGKYWESDLELEKWFDPEFQDFIDNEIVRKTSPKQKM